MRIFQLDNRKKKPKRRPLRSKLHRTRVVEPDCCESSLCNHDGNSDFVREYGENVNVMDESGVIERINDGNDDDDDDDDDDGDVDEVLEVDQSQNDGENLMNESDFDDIKMEEEIGGSRGDVVNDRIEMEVLDDQICIALKEEGAEVHFRSVTGGKLTEKTTSYVIQHIATLLRWTYKAKFNNDLPPGEAIIWFRTLIIDEYDLLTSFVTEYLGRKFREGTIRNRLSDIQKGFKWFIWFRKNAQECPIKHDFANGSFQLLLTALKASVSQPLKKSLQNNTVENALAHNHFPLGGIAELQAYVNEDLPWAYSFSENDAEVTKDSYQHFLAILAASLYVYSPQGRVGGLRFHFKLF